MIRKVNLLAINSLELEKVLLNLGIALIEFGQKRNITKNLYKNTYADYLDIVMTQFLVNIKSEFRLWYVLNGLNKGETIVVEADFLTHGDREVLRINSHELNIIVDNIDSLPLVNDNESSKREMKVVKRLVSSLFYRINKLSNFLSRKLVIEKPLKEVRLLYSDFYPNSTKILSPIFKKLSTDNAIQQVYLANRLEVKEALSKSNIESYNLEKHILFNQSFSKEESVKEGLNSFLNEFFETDWPFQTPPSERLRNFLMEVLYRKLSWSARRFPVFEDIVNHFKPTAILLTTNSSPDAKSLIAIGNHGGIKSIVFQHGIYPNSPYLYFLDATFNCVWGSYFKDMIDSWANGKTKCLITGSVKHDELAYANEKLSTNSNYILFVSTPPSNNVISIAIYTKIVAELMEAVKFYTSEEFIVKLHPSENIETFCSVVPDYQTYKNLKVLKNTPAEKLVIDAKIVMVISSSVAYEALILKKKIITISIGIKNDILPLSKHDLAIDVKSEGELINAIKTVSKLILDDKYINDFVLHDGQALPRSIKAILDC